jgi:hypothetical protein
MLFCIRVISGFGTYMVSVKPEHNLTIDSVLIGALKPMFSSNFGTYVCKIVDIRFSISLT